MKTPLFPYPPLSAEPHEKDETVRAARAVFPNGVYQPAGSFRFSVDALLLASFVKQPPGRLMADLGAGCGIVGLAYLLTHPEAVGMGFEVQPDLVEAATFNAARLGCAPRYSCLEADVTSPDFEKNFFFQSGARKNTGVKGQLVIKNSATASGFHIVLANPPYRVLGTGRLPQSLARQRALFAPRGTVERFCQAAHAILAPQGIFGVVFLAEQASWLYKTLSASGFWIQRVLPVLGREGKPPTLVLVEACKTNKAFQDKSPYEAPLVLYDKDNRLTDKARQFCPYLG